MKSLLATAIVIGALGASAAWAVEADQHAEHHATAAQAATPAKPAAPAQMHSMKDMDEKSMHEMCKSVMGADMKNKPVHEHSREKGGMAMWPNGKPLTKEEMAEMHKKCAAMMSADAAKK